MDCPGFHIVHFGIYDSRVGWHRKQCTPNRYLFQFELEFCTEDLGGIAYLEGNSYSMKEGLFLCCKPGQQRRNRLHFRCCYLHLLTDDPGLLALLHSLPDGCQLSDPAPVRAAFEKLAALPQEERKDPLLTSAVVLQLLSAVHKATEAEKRTESSLSTGQRSILLRMERHIREHLTESLTLEELAETAGFSTAHFHRLFTAFFGKTPYAFTLECRIEAAMASLQTDHCSLADIAAGCGFSSQSHFSSQFKKAIGVTPNEYRRRLLSHPEV